MGTPRQAGRFAVAALLIGAFVGWLGATGTASSEPPSDALTNEDVVRRFVTGTSEGELIRWIRESRVAFDLSDEMRDELQLAGLPAAVLRAMLERQAQQDADDDPVADEAAARATTPGSPSGLPLLIVALNDSADADGARSSDRGAPRPRLRVLDVVPRELAEQLGIRDPQARFTDVAIFLGCRTADHVPDRWRSQTPLGRDFIGTPRHRLLQFTGGATHSPAGKLSRPRLPDGVAAPEVLELEVPATLTAPLEAGVAHDLTIGIALEAGGRWYLLVRDDRDGVVIAPDASDFHLRALVSTGPDPRTLALTAHFE